MPKLLLEQPKYHDDDMLVVHIEERRDGSLTLYGTDSKGCTWALVSLSPQGLIGRHRDVPRDLGLAVSQKGKLKIDKTFSR